MSNYRELIYRINYFSLEKNLGLKFYIAFLTASALFVSVFA